MPVSLIQCVSAWEEDENKAKWKKEQNMLLARDKQRILACASVKHLE